jgi:rubrerythrin
MDIYQFAMQMEKDGENYYRQLAKESSVSGLGEILTMLADEEVNHFKAIEKLSKRQKCSLTESKVLENVKNVFVLMKESEEELHIDTAKVTSEYRKACTLEKMSRKFYLEKAEAAEEERERLIFLQLAGEEANHLRIMESIAEFVSRPEPGNWLENAEWHHLDEY